MESRGRCGLGGDHTRQKTEDRKQKTDRQTTDRQTDGQAGRVRVVTSPGRGGIHPLIDATQNTAARQLDSGGNSDDDNQRTANREPRTTNREQ